MVRACTSAALAFCFRLSPTSPTFEVPPSLLIFLYSIMFFSGASNASEIVVTGGSAGGLSVVLHLDLVAQLIPWAMVRGIAEAGYFLDVKDVKVLISISPSFSCDTCRYVCSPAGTFNVGDDNFPSFCLLGELLLSQPNPKRCQHARSKFGCERPLLARLRPCGSVALLFHPICASLRVDRHLRHELHV